MPFLSGTTYIQYNQNNGGSYQMTELAAGRWVNYYLFATTANSTNKRLLVVPSQSVHTSFSSAQAESVASIAWGGILIPEIVGVWKFTYETKSNNSTTGRVQLVEVARLSLTRSQLSGNFTAGTHNALTGRDALDSHPASAITNTPAGNITATDVQAAINDLVRLNGEKQPLTTSLTDIGAALVDADEIPVYDASVPGNRKSLLSRIWTYISGKLTSTANIFTANQIISVADNTNAALRITQTGTGNCLLVEDSANPDSSPFVIDALGRVVRGSTASDSSTAVAAAYLQIHGLSSLRESSASFVSWVTTPTSAPVIEICHSKSGVFDSHVLSEVNDILGTVVFEADDGVRFIQSSSISASVDAAPALDSMPGRLVFNTTADGGSAPTERLRINSSGNVGIGTTTISARTHIVATTEQLRLGYDATKYASFTTQSDGALALGVNGAERVRVKATGQVRFLPLSSAPSGAEAGDVYYNSTDNKLYCHNGTTWNALF
jgi:hypothetical protein